MSCQHSDKHQLVIHIPCLSTPRDQVENSSFTLLVRRSGLAARSASCRPRPHDLRHSFAVATLLDWYRDGGDVAARLPLLSTYLGHVDPKGTYWYLQAAPELLALAAERLDAHQAGRP